MKVICTLFYLCRFKELIPVPFEVDTPHVIKYKIKYWSARKMWRPSIFTNINSDINNKHSFDYFTCCGLLSHALM